MSTYCAVGLVIAFLTIIVVVLWGILAWVHKRVVARLEANILVKPATVRFEQSMLKNLPEPAVKYLLHAIRPGAMLARSVVLTQKGRMKIQPQRPYVNLSCRERLAPGIGFVWHARAKIGPIPFSITDYYYRSAGSVYVSALGHVPIVSKKGPDIAQSARGRLVAESIWCPPALLPRQGVRWESVDESHTRVVQTVDEQELAITLAVDQEGRLEEISMERFGNEGRDDWGPTPYGFRVLEEKTFSGITIPSLVSGGWWYGSERFEPDSASEFKVLEAVFS